MSDVPMPQVIEPMLARLTRELPAGEGWAFEHKWDGYRALLYADRGRLRYSICSIWMASRCRLRLTPSTALSWTDLG